MLFESGLEVTNKRTGETYPISTYSFRKDGHIAIRVIRDNGKITDWMLSSNIVRASDGEPLRIPEGYCDEYEYYGDIAVGDTRGSKKSKAFKEVKKIYRLNTTGHVVAEVVGRDNSFRYEVLDQSKRRKKRTAHQVKIEPGMQVKNTSLKKFGKVIGLDRINDTDVAKVKRANGKITNWSTINLIPVVEAKKIKDHVKIGKVKSKTNARKAAVLHDELLDDVINSRNVKISVGSDVTYTPNNNKPGRQAKQYSGTVEKIYVYPYHIKIAIKTTNGLRFTQCPDNLTLTKPTPPESLITKDGSTKRTPSNMYKSKKNRRRRRISISDIIDDFVADVKDKLNISS